MARTNTKQKPIIEQLNLLTEQAIEFVAAQTPVAATVMPPTSTPEPENYVTG